MQDFDDTSVCYSWGLGEKEEAEVRAEWQDLKLGSYDGSFDQAIEDIFIQEKQPFLEDISIHFEDDMSAITLEPPMQRELVQQLVINLASDGDDEEEEDDDKENRAPMVLRPLNPNVDYEDKKLSPEKKKKRRKRNALMELNQAPYRITNHLFVGYLIPIIHVEAKTAHWVYIWSVGRSDFHGEFLIPQGDATIHDSYVMSRHVNLVRRCQYAFPDICFGVTDYEPPFLLPEPAQVWYRRHGLSMEVIPHARKQANEDVFYAFRPCHQLTRDELLPMYNGGQGHFTGLE